MVNLRKEAGTGRRSAGLADLARNMSYEVMPFKKTEREVVDHVPTSVPLTVTVTEAKGIETTLDLTERLRAHGYQVAPHLPARQFASRAHVAETVARLNSAGVDSVFVVGGDAPEPAGEFTDAFSLLQAMEGHPFREVGIGGYPEGHATIPRATIEAALLEKAPLATQIMTQICFDADTTSRWAAGLAASGVGLPVRVGIPGPVNRQKLVRITAGIGLGQSARFLRKQQSLFWRFLLPGGYDPGRLTRKLAAAVPGNVRGLHIFTFNEIAGTEAWRRRLLTSVGDPDGMS